MASEDALRVWDNTAWVPRKSTDLRTGDLIRLRLGEANPTAKLASTPPPPIGLDVRAIQYVLPTCVDASFGEFLGLAVADATVRRTGLCLSKRHPEVVQRFATLGRGLFGADFRIRPGHNVTYCELSSTQICPWLLTFGGLAPDQKSIPEAIVESPLAVQAAFLRGLFEDGTVNNKGGILQHIEWSCKLWNAPFARSIQALLLRFGIISYKFSVISGKGFPSTRLQIYGANAARFRDRIGLISEFKKQRLMLPVPAEAKYTAPISAHESKILKPLLDASERSNLHIRKALSRDRLNRMLTRGPNSEASALINEKLAWHHDPIASIEQAEQWERQQVPTPFDLEQVVYGAKIPT